MLYTEFIFKTNIPRWIIIIIDVLVCLFAINMAYLLRFNFELPPDEKIALFKNAFLVIGLRIVTFFIFKTYSGIIRYTSTRDAIKIFTVIFTGSLVFLAANFLRFYFYDEKYFIPTSVIIIDFLISVVAMIALRVVVKITYLELHNPSRQKTQIIIYGAGESGYIAKRALDRDVGTKYKVVAFIDDDKQKIGKKIEGINVYSSDKLDALLEQKDVAIVVIAIQGLSASKKSFIAEKCLTHQTKVFNVPPVSRWINGELSFKQIKKIRIEDLLEREVIKLDEKKVSQQIAGKVVLVTGAAGSIGSEMVRQIIQYAPNLVVLLDQAETPLYHMELELCKNLWKCKYEILIGDVRSEERMEKLFQTFKPNIVFHAAAYKHVPMMENNPSEAVLTNVLGTKIMADLALKYSVEKFVMVSTDKAVNPTNVMGASKRIAEIYTQALNSLGKTKFVTTRFGNVLGSNGSVIPLFYKQIENGGPITITHPEVTRYFMTIPEACQLVLQAGTMGNGGEIFIFDMGKSIKILDLAKKMIQLSGLTLGRDIQITYTSLRPGEKLYEELLNNSENTIPTYHPQIMIAKVKEIALDEISEKINQLIDLFKTQNNFEIVKLMKNIVPEYVSQNSIFEKLDV